MSIFDMMSVNYREIFNNIMQSQDAQCMMADFLNHCLLHCDETRACIIDILSKDENFQSVVDKSIEKIAKKNKMKTEFFND